MNISRIQRNSWNISLIHIRWGTYKFPKETPLLFYRGGEPIEPPLSIHDGMKVVIKSMASYIDREMPSSRTLKLWRSQSPRHFDGGEWDHNGSCVTGRLLEEDEVAVPSILNLNSEYLHLKIQKNFAC